jgi:hypothetical protein
MRERRGMGGTEAIMKHPSIRELFEYWNGQRGSRLAPERAEIEPGAIRRVLADTFILSVEPAAGHPFRIAGTRVCALFNRELKGEAFLDLWSTESRRDVSDLLTIVADESVAVAASASAVCTAQAGLPSQRAIDRVRLELVLLPLRHHGRTDARFLGALAPSEPPAWLGTSPPAGLTLGTHRYVGPAAAGTPRGSAILPKAHLALGGGRIRHGFVVYDGGQS